MPKRYSASLANFSRFPAEAIKAVVASLSQAQKKYCIAYFYEGMNMREISELYGVNKSTVSRTISRAKQNIGSALKYCNIK